MKKKIFITLGIALGLIIGFGSLKFNKCVLADTKELIVLNLNNSDSFVFKTPCENELWATLENNDNYLIIRKGKALSDLCEEYKTKACTKIFNVLIEARTNDNKISVMFSYNGYEYCIRSNYLTIDETLDLAKEIIELN